MTINFNVAPYYDDYNEDDGYLRVLFRPGYSVQARELTQLQTILQKQVERFGNHIFKNGSMVIPGGVNVDNQVHFMKLEDLSDNLTVSSYISSFQNKIIIGVESGVKALVVDTSDCDCMVPGDSDIPTLYFKIESTGGDGDVKKFIPGEQVIAYAVENTTSNNYRLTENQVGDFSAVIKSIGDDGSLGTLYTDNPVSDVMGFAYAVEVDEGIYYIDGFFVRNEELHLYIGRFTRNVSFRVGFKITEELITPEEQPLLADNAQGTTNYAAPGAHRYKINLSLVRLALDSADDIKFIELLRVVDGQVQTKLEHSDYSELEKTLARRTFDQSGSYEVTKFKLTTREHLNDDGSGVYPPRPVSGAITDQTYGDDDKFVIAVDPGKAYIEGFEVESTQTQFIDLDKARENTLSGEEGGHIVRETQFPISTPVGNYLIVKNVYNYPDFEVCPVVNLYSVSRNPANGTPIADGTLPDITKKVGTARVRAFQLHSGSYNGDATEFKLSLFEIQMDTNPATGLPYSFEKRVKSIGISPTYAATVGITDLTTLFTCDVVSTNLSIIGSASIASGSAEVNGIGTLFVTEVQAGDILLINGEHVGVVASIQSNVKLTLENVSGDPETISGLIEVFRANIRDAGNVGLLFKSEFTTLKTLRGQDSSGNDTIKESIQVVRRILDARSATAGTWTYALEAGESFLSSSDLSNYTLYYTDISTGTKEFVTLLEDDISLSNSNRDITITNGSLQDGKFYTLIASVMETGNVAAEKTKSLNSATQTITGRKAVSENVLVLDYADVLRITDIRVTPGNFDTYNENASISILDRYIFDNGQRATHYQAGRLTLKPNQSPPSGAIRITYDYFGRIGTGNYFSVDSYSAAIDATGNNFTYSDIPSFSVRGVDGSTQDIYLHDVIDYRPTIEGLNQFIPLVPKIGRNFITSIAYYLPRFDKIVLDNVGRFNVIKGVPGLDPREPKDPSAGLVMATCYVPAYTKSAKDVRLFPRDNRRYTMKDIGNLEKRIQNLEYYVSLTLLEQETSTLSIKDANTGLDRFKNGFIVDQFTGHGIGDVKNIDYRIAVDQERQELRPMHFTDAIELVEYVDTSEERDGRNYKRHGDVITLPYDEQLFMFNPYGTRTIDVNPYKVGAFKGEITLSPEGDNWKDTDRRPDLQVTDDNNYDAIRFMAEQLGVTGTVWNEWQTQWTGSTTTTTNWQTGNPNRRRQIVTGYQQTTRVDTGVRSREGIRTSIQSSVNTQDYGDRVVDISFAPYMRARPVAFVAQNLKPASKFYGFFDGEAVSDYIQPSDIFSVRRSAGSTLMQFDTNELAERVVASDAERSFDGKDEPAFQIGDILRNSAHTPVVINTIANITAENTRQFTMTVADATNLSPGHIIQVYNLGPGRIRRRVRNRRGRWYWQTTVRNRNIPVSAEINNRTFKILKVDGTTLTLAAPNGGVIPPFSAYNKSAFSTNDGGRIRRLQASGVVIYGGDITEEDSNGAVVQEIHVANIKNGFAVGEDCTGKITFQNGQRNSVAIESINGLTVADQDAIFADPNAALTGAVPVMKQIGDALRTDRYGACSGVFHLPNSDALRFRTGERDFKLTDNISNSDADFDSKGSATYYSQGVTLSKERTVVNSRQANFVQDRLYESIPVRRVSVSTRVLYRYYTGHDPVAQTFAVQSDGGAFITSVDMYFSEPGNRPITVELRTTNNGVPSSKIMPFTTVTKSPNQIKVSDDGTVATNFRFQAPVFLQDNEMYALVVKTDEPGAQVFVSEVGKTDIATDNIVTVQPLTGSLYLSQNSKEFEINPLLDLKFRMYRAQFDIDQVPQVDFKASIPKDMILPENPFEITPGTDIVRVHAPRHGFSAGEQASIDHVAEWADEDETIRKYYGTGDDTYGIPPDLLNGEVEVLAQGLDQDYFCFRLDTQDEYVDDQGNVSPNILLKGGLGTETTVQEILDQFIKGNYGGSGVTCSRQLFVDNLFLKSDSIIPSGTTLTWKAQAIDGNGTPTGYLPIDENQNFSFGARKVVRSYENEEEINSAVGTARPSLTMQAQLTSTNVNLSPVIDLQKIAAFAIRNLINDPVESLINVVEIDARTLLEDGNVVATDIDSVQGEGTLTAYVYENVFGVLDHTVTTDAGNLVMQINTANFFWTGEGSAQETYERLHVGDVLYTTGTDGTNVSGARLIGTVIGFKNNADEDVTQNATKVVIDRDYDGVTGSASFVNDDQFVIVSRKLTGVNTEFTTQAPPGTLIRNASGDPIGIVDQTDSDTVVRISTLAQAANGNVSYFIETPEAKLTLTNSNGKGLIRTSIDTADNLLGLTKAGKYIYIDNIIAGVNGKWLVESVSNTTDTTVSVGNEEQDKIEILLTQPFQFVGAATSYTLDLINGYIYFQGAGAITFDGTTEVIGTASTFLSQVKAGDIITLQPQGGDEFNSATNVIGVVATNPAINTELELTENSPVSGGPSNYYIRKQVTGYKFAQLDKYVEDWAPNGTSNYANYISRRLVLSNPAEAVKVIFEANVPTSTGIKIFYKGWVGETDPDSLNYLDSGFSPEALDPVDTFTERTIDIETEPFTSLVVKIVMKSTNPANVPKIKNLRIIAHS